MTDRPSYGRNTQNLGSRRPVDVHAGASPASRGPCGLDDERAGCRQVVVNLFSVLLESDEFKQVWEEIVTTEVKIIRNDDLPLLKSLAGGREKPGGLYDPITGTIELPADVYASKSEVRTVKALRLIAHEIYHAWQYRKLHELSAGGGAKERARIIAESVKDMGRKRFISKSMDMEKAAEEFAVRTVLSVLKHDHSGYSLYREVIGSGTPKDYYEWEIGDWWYANESIYEEEAEIEWVQWTYRYAEKDYDPEFDKDNFKKWLERNPGVKGKNPDFKHKD